MISAKVIVRSAVIQNATSYEGGTYEKESIKRIT